MTRVLGNQVNDPRTKYNRLSLSVSPNTSSSTIAPATLNPLSTSGIPGGSDRSLFPKAISTATEPFVFSTGTIGIRIDGGSTISVALLNTDNNVGLIAKKINAAAGATIATWFNGRLMIKGNGASGSAGSLQLSNISGSILTALGLPTSLIQGVDANVRGIITDSTNDFGGFVQLRLPGRQNIVTNASEFAISSDDSSLVDLTYNPTVPGGAPIHGRLSFDGTNYKLGYYASLPSHGEIVMQGGDYASVGASDTLIMSVTANGRTRNQTFSFLAGPNTRDSVIDRINSIWGSTLLGVSNARATIRNTISEPYTFNNEIIYIAVNGGAEVPITLTSATVTIPQLITLIEGAVPGIDLVQITNATQSIARWTTTSGTGFRSSISIRDDDAPGNNALAKLGIAAGLYVGPTIARPRGQFDIVVSAPNRGSRSSITLNANGSSGTVTRLGLPGLITVATGSDSQSDVSVNLPDLTIYGKDIGGVDPDITSYQLDAIFPEVVSFGEIPTTYASEAEEFDGIASNSNSDPRRDLAITYPSTRPTTYGNKLKNASQVVNAGPDGQVDLGQMRKSSEQLLAYLKQFLEANWHTTAISRIVINELATRGSGNNPFAVSPEMLMSVDPDAESASPRKFKIQFGGVVPEAYVFEPTLLTAQGSIDLGTAYSSIATSRVTARVSQRILNTTSVVTTDRQLVQEIFSSIAGRIRIYAQTSTFISTSLQAGNYEVTFNAAWDGTQWVKDISSASAWRNRLGLSLFAGQAYHKQTTNVATFLDSDWLELNNFPPSPILGNENRFSKLLRIGQDYSDGGATADGDTPRLIIPVNYTSPSIQRTLLWRTDPDTASGPIIRMYASVNVNQAGGSSDNGAVELTYNAVWNSATSRWNRDTSGSASKIQLGDRGFAYRCTSNNPPSSWDDTDQATGWRTVGGSFQSQCISFIANSGGAADFNISGGVVFHNTFVGSNNALNVLHANLIPKIYGRVVVNSGAIDGANAFAFGATSMSISGNILRLSYLYVPDDASRVVGIVSFSTNMSGISAVACGVTHNTIGGTLDIDIRNTAGNNVSFSGLLRVGLSFAVYYDVAA